MLVLTEPQHPPGHDHSWSTCTLCGDDYPTERKLLGYTYCCACGDSIAADERKSWCIIQEYGKGPYQLVTATAAPRTLRETNQKQPR